MCFVFECNGHHVSWIPSDAPLSTELDKYEWRNEFAEMKRYVLGHFRIGDVTFCNGQNKDDTIDHERDLKHIWKEMLSSSCLAVFRAIVKEPGSGSDSGTDSNSDSNSESDSNSDSDSDSDSKSASKGKGRRAKKKKIVLRRRKAEDSSKVADDVGDILSIRNRNKERPAQGRPNAEVGRIVKGHSDGLEYGIAVQEKTNKEKEDTFEQCLSDISNEDEDDDDDDDDDKKGEQKVRRHPSGIYDRHNIIFTLQELKSEDRDVPSVNKCILHPEYIGRLINYFVPNACRDNAKVIDFHCLERVQVTPIGLFGDKVETVELLMKLGVLSASLRSFMLSDKDCLAPGIHALLPFKRPKSLSPIPILLFYWPVRNAFTKNYIKRKNISCLFARVLQEVSATLCIPVSKQELIDSKVGKVEPVRTGVILDFQVKKENSNSIAISDSIVHQIDLKKTEAVTETTSALSSKAKASNPYHETAVVLTGMEMSDFYVALQCRGPTTLHFESHTFQSKQNLHAFLRDKASTYQISYRKDLPLQEKLELASVFDESIVQMYKKKCQCIYLHFFSVALCYHFFLTAEYMSHFCDCVCNKQKKKGQMSFMNKLGT
ncbi:hypothetical protein RFI_17419 [Reticulomyxa filosa]|uniref:Uncharacterized protein n=1 Tax=Reticulomyxa filosa TaxID=46433 RepID=X6N3C6_RETFI|nr:hypothetical protein RFI_17419 [Reticulomyxa filosa]|eukprot:ETO19812.1 hypothetical protein RFI_17419 [Reticulomyxa filosa]